MAEITLTSENFKAEVLESKVPVLVDFWATWCGPCQMMGPVVEELANESDGSFKARFAQGLDSFLLRRDYKASRRNNCHVRACPGHLLEYICVVTSASARWTFAFANTQSRRSSRD